VVIDIDRKLKGETMSDTAQYVADRMALMDVMLKYAKGCDERDLALYRSVFADDAVISGFGDKTYNGGDAWTDYVIEALGKFGPTQHMLGPQLATIDGDTAECRTDVQATHYLKDKPDTTFTLWATYETTMKRIGGEWKIARHHLVPRGTRTQSD
jgi:ketosteroid isomerase-like protein